MTMSDQVGLTGPAYTVEIERGKIREFARAMAAPLPEYLQEKHPCIPALFLVCAPYHWGYTLERPRGTVFSHIDHDLSVSLHAGESFEFFGPMIRAGDELTAVMKLEAVTRKQGRHGGELSFFTMLTQYRDPSGQLRASQRSINVTTGNAAGSADWSVELPTYEPDYSLLERPSPFATISRAGFDDLDIGDGPGAIEAPPLLKQDIVRFQGVVGEDDPLHHDREWARKQGYPDVFALGTHIAGMMTAYAAYWIDPRFVRSLSIRFQDMVWPGERLVYRAEVTDKDAEQRRLEIKLTCSRPDGIVVNTTSMGFDFQPEQDQ